MNAHFRSYARPVLALTMAVAALGMLGGCGTRLVNGSETRQLRWGEPVDGLQAGLSVNEYRAGKRARLTVTYAVRNVGDVPLLVAGLPYYAGPARYYPGRGPVHADDGGQRTRRVEPLTTAPPPESALEYLEPGQQAVLTGGIDPGQYRLGAVFDAALTFVYDVPPRPAPAKADDAGAATAPRVWSGRAQSAPVKIRVRF